MGFQKCPICNGTGFECVLGTQIKCTVCDGQKIISELTGKPPKSPEVKTSGPQDMLVGPGPKGYYSDYHKTLGEELEKKFFKII